MRKLFLGLAIISSLVFAFSKKPPAPSGSTESGASSSSSSVIVGKQIFPVKEWQEHAINTIKASKLAGYTPKDYNSFCPKWNDANYVALLGAMTKYESDFKPSTTYKENFKNSRGEYVISTGMLQLSYESARGYGFSDATTEKLKDPKYNITVAVKILEKWIKGDGLITSGGSPYKGGGRYWSCLRNSGKLSSVKSYMKQYCQ